MAQLVERTLGKGEVPSSILGISTSRHYSIKSLNCQNISSDFNYSDFSNYFFKNFNFGLNKPLLHSLSADRAKTDKNYTKKIDILCENESVIQPSPNQKTHRKIRKIRSYFCNIPDFDSSYYIKRSLTF